LFNAAAGTKIEYGYKKRKNAYDKDKDVKDFKLYV
jgi:hypothetical protein